MRRDAPTSHSASRPMERGSLSTSPIRSRTSGSGTLPAETLIRLTKTPSFDLHPVWTTDGSRIIFSSSSAGTENLFWQAADSTGAVERLTTSPHPQIATAVTPGEARVILPEVVPATGSDLRTLSLDTKTGGPGQLQPLLHTTFNELHGQVSPDGRWLAYQSNDSGQYQVSVRPFPNVEAGNGRSRKTGGRYHVVAEWPGAVLSRWCERHDGGASAHGPSSVPAPRRSSSTGRSSRWDRSTYDVLPDGQRFLMIKDIESSDQKSPPRASSSSSTGPRS